MGSYLNLFSHHIENIHPVIQLRFICCVNDIKVEHLLQKTAFGFIVVLLVMTLTERGSQTDSPYGENFCSEAF